MSNHRAQEDTAAVHPTRGTRQHAVWVRPGEPDPFRAAGVPDRLVIVLNREGLHYTGTMTTWEYREIEVRRGRADDGTPLVVTEMVVDASMPHQVPIMVQMHQRPTAARLVAELVDVLRAMIGPLAGRERRPDELPQRRIHLR